MDIHYMCQEGKEAQGRDLRMTIKENENLEGVFSYKGACMVHFWKP